MMAWGALALCAIVGCSPTSDHGGGVSVSSLASPASATTVQDDAVTRARLDSVNRAQPGYVIDSILPPDEAMRRFTDGLPRTTAFAYGASSRDALVRQWVHAVERSDSLALIRTAVNRREFAFLVYPSLPLSSPPTYQPPAIAWLQLSNGSVQGFRRTLTRFGGRTLGFAGYRCPRPAERTGDLTVWRGCIVQRISEDGAQDAVLFGAIVVRDGIFKFLSLANDL